MEPTYAPSSSPLLSTTSPTAMETMDEINNDGLQVSDDISNFVVVHLSVKQGDLEIGSVLLNISSGDALQPNFLQHDLSSIAFAWHEVFPNLIYYYPPAILELDSGIFHSYSDDYGVWSATGDYLIRTLQNATESTTVSILNVKTDYVDSFTINSPVRAISTSYDDRYILFRTIAPDKGDENKIIILDTESGAAVYEHLYEADFYGIWSPVDYGLLLVLNVGGDPYSEGPRYGSKMEIIDGSSGALLKDVTNENYLFSSPDWSHDGTKLVFSNIIEGQRAEICTLVILAEEIDCLTGGSIFGGNFNIYPKWTLSDQIVFETENDGICFPLAIINLDGSGAKIISNKICTFGNKVFIIPR
jgi:hypothetical protein